MLSLSLSQSLNLTVRFLSEFQFETWYEDEFDKSLEEILAAGNTGVVLALAKASKRLGAKQGHFLVVKEKKSSIY